MRQFILDKRRKSALPSTVFAAECEAPSREPAEPLLRRVGRALRHLGGVEVAGVRGVEHHATRVRLEVGAYARMAPVTSIAIIGGGPGGYEAALVAAQLEAEVTVIDRDGLGGSTVLTDCVPSKTLIATSEVMTQFGRSAELGVDIAGRRDAVGVDLAKVNERVKRLAHAQ